MVRNKYVLPILNLMAFIGTIAVNALANALPINGVTTGGLSDKYPNLFVPSGITFSIWGVIYVLLGVFVVYQFTASRGRSSTPLFVQQIGLWFVVSCLANIGWIFAWHYEIIPLSLLLMLLLLASLIKAYLRLGVGEATDSQDERYLVHLPFSVYLGWITVATIANVTTLLVSIGWDGFGVAEQWWAVAVIGAAIFIAILVLATRRDIFFALVVDWALFGIVLKRYAASDPASQPVLIGALVGMLIVTLGVVALVLKKRVYGPPA